MKFRTLILFILIALVAGFVAVNWSAFVAQTQLSLGVASVEAPLGLIMLGVAICLAVPLLVYAMYLQRAAVTQAARQAERLDAQRKLADDAEASRFSQLRHFLDEELQQNATREQQLRSDLLARLDQLETDLRTLVARRDPEPETAREPADAMPTQR